MTSKSLSIEHQRRVSRRQLGHHTHPVIDTGKTCQFKKCLKIFGKKRKTSPSPEPAPRDNVVGCVCKAPTDKTVPGPTSCISGPSSTRVKKKNRKSDESTDALRKRRIRSPSPTEDPCETFSGASSTKDPGKPTPVCAEGQSGNRKAEDAQKPRKRSRKGDSPSEDNPGSSSSVTPLSGPSGSMADFEAKYTQKKLLGKGGFGRVYEGYCKDTNLPVAIKHIRQRCVSRTAMYLDGQPKMVPLEVALLLKVKPAAGAKTSAPVSLLDWYDLDTKLILVQERPVPCMDLLDFINSRGSFLQENEAKDIMKQLVDGLIEVKTKGVFHRDIKLDNILLETGSDVPRVRLIDFGCGTLFTEERYTSKSGTYDYFSPEMFKLGWYKAEPTTVWQLGVALFGMLHGRLPFSNQADIVFARPVINGDLSYDCQGFIQSCLEKNQEARPTLETLKNHPWLM